MQRAGMNEWQSTGGPRPRNSALGKAFEASFGVAYHDGPPILVCVKIIDEDNIDNEPATIVGGGVFLIGPDVTESSLAVSAISRFAFHPCFIYVAP